MAPRRAGSRVLAFGAVAALGACASSVVLTEPPLAKRDVSRGTGVALAEFGGDGCLRQEAVRYLNSAGGLTMVADRPAEVTIGGDVRRIEVHSNRGDKEAAISYFTAFVITAPIAAVMYAAKDWHADASAEGRLFARDRAGVEIWSRETTVSVSEAQRTLPSHEALKAAMASAACRKLASTLLNGLAEHLAATRGR